MKLKITHKTEYTYDAPVRYALQRVRLFPQNGATQSVQSWSLSVAGAREELRFNDHFGNDTRLLSVEGEPHVISITGSGEVVTKDTAGVTGAHRGFAPLWFFVHETPLTRAGPGITEFAKSLTAATDIELLHKLMGTIRDKVDYVVGSTTTETTAEDAFLAGKGVCQDHAHIFLAAIRALRFPGRYVSGYLMLEDESEQAASHAWAEAYVEGLGWVSFDVANCMSSDERYVRLACGRDYRDAMPISGIRLGQAQEQLAVLITVEQ